MKLINIGFGNMLSSSKIVAIVSPDSAPSKRIVQEAKDKGVVIDASQGRRTRAVIAIERTIRTTPKRISNHTIIIHLNACFKSKAVTLSFEKYILFRFYTRVFYHILLQFAIVFSKNCKYQGKIFNA